MPDLSGLDEIDWAALHHAYGPATDVPDMLRGLASGDAKAMADFVGAVHHQGDVYDSTVAAVPFLLRAAERVEGTDRAELLFLLADLGGVDAYELTLLNDIHGAYFEWVFTDNNVHPRYPDDYAEAAARDDQDARAALAVSAGRPFFLRLLDDPDAGVRCGAFLAASSGPLEAATVDTLLDRLRDERNAEVLDVVVTGLGIAAARVPAAVRTTVLDRLAETATAHPRPGVRLRALMELARRSSDPLPVDAETLAATMRRARSEARAERLSSARADGPRASGVGGEWLGSMNPDEVSLTLGDHVGLRAALLVRLLDEPDEWDRSSVLSAATDLVAGWRGDHRSLIEAIEALPAASDPGADTAGFLEAAGQIAEPEAGAVSSTGTEGQDLHALVEDFEDYPTLEVAHALRDMGPAAAAAAPVLRRELDEPRRHSLRAEETIEPDLVGEDEALLLACAEALAAITR
ncbi:hypothetical protein ACFXKD_20470 [Nocardiopsis aegyptia]|uniref:hypothetical protein n=1 Tax=Nocardiopsis aegyptia TaxID=220378 RepID=UPI00366BFC2A